MSEPRPNRRFQFSLKSMLIAVSAIFLALPLLPFIALLGLWYLFDPGGAPADIVMWGANRLDPRLRKQRRG
jgi:hypothetical protein